MMKLTQRITPKVTLVGAGPGDPDLMTVKGIKALKTADVVLYDALANPQLLDYAPPLSKKVYVGKRANNHRYQQEEINQLIVQYALNFGHVVRLKGGDSFVFGRGQEEIEYAKSFGVETAVIPGISSCIAASELQGVPLTSRGISESFWVLTATTRAGQLAEDIRLAAQSTATLVILMGMRKLPEIAAILQQQGRGNVPVMVVQSSSLETEKYAIGTVDTIVDVVQEKGLKTPGTIVIGEVVWCHPAMVLNQVDLYRKSA